MGAVFALYSAWYYWIPKILGVNYNWSLAKIHFWLLFLGVNITFFPQHFLGLQGMPRRISDYPDAFWGWNFVSSVGSLISVIATWLFLHILYMQLIEGKAIIRNPWLTPSFYIDTLQYYLTRSYESLEWGLSNPPKPHAFVSLPLSSSFSELITVTFISSMDTDNFFFNFYLSLCICGIIAPVVLLMTGTREKLDQTETIDPRLIMKPKVGAEEEDNRTKIDLLCVPHGSQSVSKPFIAVFDQLEASGGNFRSNTRYGLSNNLTTQILHNGVLHTAVILKDTGKNGQKIINRNGNEGAWISKAPLTSTAEFYSKGFPVELGHANPEWDNNTKNYQSNSHDAYRHMFIKKA